MPQPQTYANHTRLVPGYHYVAFGLLAINLLWSGYRAVTVASAETIMSLVFALGVMILFFYARLFPLAAQDRVIRLEMRLRLGELLPADLRPRIQDLTTRQLVALRFASDAELPDLVRAVLTDRITDGRTIKQRITQWQADEQRV